MYFTYLSLIVEIQANLELFPQNSYYTELNPAELDYLFTVTNFTYIDNYQSDIFVIMKYLIMKLENCNCKRYDVAICIKEKLPWTGWFYRYLIID